MDNFTIPEGLQQAAQHHQAGRLPEAEAFYRAILALDSNCVGALHGLGILTLQVGRYDLAVEVLNKAAVLFPGDPAIHSNLGEAYRHIGRLSEAVASYRRALALQPDFCNALGNLGLALTTLGQYDEAIVSLQKAIALKPDFAEAHNNLGNIFKDRGQLNDALACYRKALRFQPRLAMAHNNLGLVLNDLGQPNEAVTCFRQALTLEPDLAEAYNNLGLVFSERGQPDEALTCLRRAFALKPDLPGTRNNLGNLFKERGQLDDAIACYREALATNPDSPECHSNLIMALLCHSKAKTDAITAELRNWNEQHARPLARFVQRHNNDRNPSRRLRIGYVSPDFRLHPVGCFLRPLLSAHDRSAFEIFGYSNSLQSDQITAQLRAQVDHWCDVSSRSDQQVADLIRTDRIDILVDLALHTARNRLLVFAQKPAPLQVTFAGYPGTTGLPAIDFRLTDPYLDPPGLFDTSYSEASVRLPDSFWIYAPLGDEPAVHPLPAETNRYITFGNLNSFCKVNSSVLELWAKVLHAVNRSRVRLLAAAGEHRQHVLDSLNREGISSDRVEFSTRRPRSLYLDLYHDIDIGLDTLPYNGHTTSLDSYWMGVPVVTLVGQTVVGRAGWSQLSNLGLTELAAHTEDEFVRIASTLAHDVPRLAALRASLRDRMQLSPLMDAPHFARAVESAYRTMWQRWCARPESAAIATR